jgi:ankyrin repeat protein
MRLVKPIEYALYNNHADAVDLLISNGAHLYGRLIYGTHSSYMRSRLIIHYGLDITKYRKYVIENSSEVCRTRYIEIYKSNS